MLIFLETVFEELTTVMQPARYHPEGDVFSHLIQCANIARAETTDKDLIIASLLHDVGKLIRSNGHEVYTIEIMCEFLSEKAKWLVKHHMRVQTLFDGTMKKKSKIIELTTHPWFPQLVHLASIDKRGRKPISYRYNAECLRNYFSLLQLKNKL